MADIELLKKFQGKSVADYLSWENPANFLEMARNGILVPFADAFQYKGKGFLLVGPSTSGKTSLSGHFVKWNNRYSKRLGRDSTTTGYDIASTKVYESRNNDLADFTGLSDPTREYPLIGIFHLASQTDNSSLESLDQVVETMFARDANGKNVQEELRYLAEQAYANIPIIGVPWKDSVHERCFYFRGAVHDFL